MLTMIDVYDRNFEPVVPEWATNERYEYCDDFTLITGAASGRRSGRKVSHLFKGFTHRFAALFL